MIVLATYDISDDDRRSSVAALLQTWGDRVQRSVFVLELEAGDLKELIDHVRAAIDPRTDSVHVFPQCERCWSGLMCLGQAGAPEKVLYWSVW